MDFSSSSSSLYKAPAKPPISDTSSAYAGFTATPAYPDTAGGGGGERERMFEKVVTPSDVGKLNRLVIPKQHAEKYFPLDAAAGEKGLLLNFEECRSSGKSWRFRYSYWSSSQSYVITKGWSRFVKDKKLDAGDVVSFFRSFVADDSVNGARLYIDWSRRRRPDQRSATLQFHHGISINPWCYNYSPATPPALQLMGVRPFPPYHHHQGAPVFEPAPPPIHHRRDLSIHGGGFGGNYGVITQNSCLHHGSAVFFGARGGHCQVGSGAGAGPTAFESLPVANEKVAPKRLRLFGVNMDCTTTQEEDCNDVVVLPSSRIPSSSSTLQDHHNPSSDATTTINFLGKGKSSMSLDFDL